MPNTISFPPDRRRGLARIAALASSLVFLTSLLIMIRWIFRLGTPKPEIDATLPSGYEAIVPLVSLTLASLTFPILVLSLIYLARPKNMKDDSGLEE